MPGLTISSIEPDMAQAPRALVVGGAGAVDLLAALRQAGFQAHVVVSVAEALDEARRAVPDVVVVEHAPPDVDAFALARTLRAEAVLPPIVGIHAGLAGTSHLEAVRAGFDDWFSRHVPVELVVERARALVRASATQRAAVAKATDLMLFHDWVRYLLHDLRGPLFAIEMGLSYLRDDLRAAGGLERERLEAIAGASGELRRAGNMINDILDVSRIRHGALALKVESLDLEDVARLAAVAAAAPVPITVNGDGNAALQGDRALLERVFANLIGNAVRFSGENPVELMVEGSLAEVTARVRNRGAAIPAEMREHLFEPWSRALAGPTGVHATGLGLSFCRLVVQTHGGRIWLDSGEEGNVVFAFSLPRALAE